MPTNVYGNVNVLFSDQLFCSCALTSRIPIYKNALSWPGCNQQAYLTLSITTQMAIILYEILDQQH